jgi:hypothetical protein
LEKTSCSWKKRVAVGKNELQLEKMSCSWKKRVAVGKNELQLEKTSCSWKKRVAVGKNELQLVFSNCYSFSQLLTPFVNYSLLLSTTARVPTTQFVFQLQLVCQLLLGVVD